MTNTTSTPSTEPRDEPARPDGRAAADSVRVRRITVLTGRAVMDVEIGDERMRSTTPALAHAAAKRYPSLPGHACVNGEGPTFSHVMDRTSVPHLLEHLVIDIQVRLSPEVGASFAGTSEWLDEEAGLARVQVSFADDLVFFRALDEALGFLSELLERGAEQS